MLFDGGEIQKARVLRFMYTPKNPMWFKLTGSPPLCMASLMSDCAVSEQPRNSCSLFPLQCMFSVAMGRAVSAILPRRRRRGCIGQYLACSAIACYHVSVASSGMRHGISAWQAEAHASFRCLSTREAFAWPKQCV